MNIKLESPQSNVLVVRGDTDVRTGWEKWVMLSSDHHLDNVHTRRDLITKHFEKAKERDAMIFLFGDTFCAMQGKYDPRSSMDDIRPEDVGQNYLDLICAHAAEFYGPYAKNIAMISQGNHETSISKRHGTDLVSNLVHRLNVDHGGNVAVGGYGGWVRFTFKVHGTRPQSVNLKYHHGAGGGGPVTKGVIQTNRQAVYLPDADLVVNGHTHDGWVVPLARERLTNKGRVTRDVVNYVRTPSYKDEYGDGSKGWHIERWGPPKPLGCVWMRFYYDRNRGVTYDLTPEIE